MKLNKMEIVWISALLNYLHHRMKIPSFDFRFWLFYNLNNHIKALWARIFRTMKVKQLPSIPANENPFWHDMFNMGHYFSKEVVVMYKNHADSHCPYLIIVHVPTGQRIEIEFPSDTCPVEGWDAAYVNSGDLDDNLQVDEMCKTCCHQPDCSGVCESHPVSDQEVKEYLSHKVCIPDVPEGTVMIHRNPNTNSHEMLVNNIHIHELMR